MVCKQYEAGVIRGRSATLKDWTRRNIDLNLITDILAKYYRVSIDEIMGRSRKGILPEVRHLCWYFGLMYTAHTQYDLETYYGRDRTAAVHARQRVKDLMWADPAFKLRVDAVDRLITGCA